MKFNDVAVFKNRLFLYSETFIKEQAEGMKKGDCFYFSTSKVKADIGDIKQDWLSVYGDGLISKVLQNLFVRRILTSYHEKKLKEKRPSLIHSHFGVDGVTILPLAKKLNIPLIVTFHGYDICVKPKYAAQSFFSHRLFHKEMFNLFKYATKIIAVSEFIKEKLIQAGCPKEKIIVHYIGINIQKIKVSYPIENKKKQICFVGRLVEKKGAETLINGFKQFHLKNPDFELLIIGDGILREKLTHLSEGFSSIKFLGPLPHSKVLAIIEESYIFSVPSQEAFNGDCEAFGMVFAEAQSLGTPVISTFHGGIPEVVKHNETGLLVDEGDSSMLANYLNELVSNPFLWNRLRSAGIKNIEDNFNLSIQCEKLREIYSSCKKYS